MTPNPTIYLTLVLLAAAPALSNANGLQDQVLSVEGPRPIAKAMVYLERQYNEIITYEDPPYVYEGDLEDARQIPGGKPLFIPRTRRVEINRPVGVSLPRSVLMTMIRAAVEADGQHRNRGPEYEVRSSSYGLHLVPQATHDEAGVQKSIVPILDARVTLKLSSADIVSFARALCVQLTAITGVRVLPGTLPRSLSGRTMPIKVADETARMALIKFLEAVESRLSWHLLYEVSERAFILNLGRPGELMP